MGHLVADELVNRLVQAGVKRIYGIVGDSLNPVTDAVRRNGKIDWIHVRHEETAAFAAGAEAQLTGKLTACAGSCGPGNLHLINVSLTRIAVWLRSSRLLRMFRVARLALITSRRLTRKVFSRSAVIIAN